MLGHHHRVAQVTLQRMAQVNGGGAGEAVGALHHLGTGLGNMDRRQTQQAGLLRRHRVAREDRVPYLFGGVVEKSACGGELGFSLGDLDAHVSAVGQFRRAGDAAAARHAADFVQCSTGQAEVDHRQHLRGVGNRRVAEQRFVDGRGTATDEGPALVDALIGHTQVMAAGAFEADHIPVLNDVDLLRAKHSGARLAASGTDAHAQQVCAFAAAGKFPGAVDLIATFHGFGRLQWEQTASEHQIRAVGVEFSEGFLRQSGQVNAGAAETGHPAGRAVGFGDALDHLQEQRWRQGVAAEAFRRGGAVDAHLFETLDHVPWHMRDRVEFLSTLAHFIQYLRKGLAIDDILVNADQSVLLRNR
ncbi:hypothetical protein D3C71_1318060 [compost metagenome]